MIGVLRADPAAETATFGAGAAEQTAVQHLSIDNLVQAPLRARSWPVIDCSVRSTRWSCATAGAVWVARLR
jgi:hypothetical protein